MAVDSSSLGPRQLNRFRVIETLYRYPEATRFELAHRTGLSRATVSNLIDELREAGVVEERDHPDGRPRTTGRPPILLSLASDAAFAVGLDIGHRHVRAAVCDLSGTPIADEWSPADVDDAYAETLDLAERLVGKALGDAALAEERLLGVGVGLAAPIDNATGEVDAGAILPGWDGTRPAEELSARLGLPVQLDNDANVGALGEQVFGAARGVEDLIYVRLSAGIGAGLVVRGQPYRGHRGLAGEIGHVAVDPAGHICRCGNRGCLETVASPVAVADLLERTLGRRVDVDTLLDLVRSGDRGARRAIADAGEAIGRALSSFVNALNPELVLVGGELAAAGPVLLEPIQSAMERHSVPAAAAGLRVEAGALGERAEVLGAAALALAQSPHALARRVAS
jgi:predicted NBD/HSP70 family sugar kinase